MLVSPAEPAVFRSLGVTSSVPETYGADFLYHSREFGLVGVQRKEVNDLVASVHDGRLQKEVMQWKALGKAILLIEGKLQWSDDGLLMAKSTWTRAQHLGLVLSMQSRGTWIVSTSGQADTIASLGLLTKWLAKTSHNTLDVRPTASSSSVWGRADSRDFGVHILQGFPGIGVVVAGRIYDHFNGVPLQWTVTEKELYVVEGIGKGRAKQLTTIIPPADFEG